MKKRLLSIITGIVLLFGCTAIIHAAEYTISEDNAVLSANSFNGSFEKTESASNELYSEAGQRIKGVILAENVASGNIGALSWQLSTSGVLTVSGNGAIPDFESVSSSPWYEFSNSVKRIKIEKGVTSIGDNSFALLLKAEKITIPVSVTRIGDYAFYYCSQVSDITIPGSVKTIGDYSFKYCSALKSISISTSVTKIGDHAFDYCYALKSINYNGTRQQWDKIRFSPSSSFYSTVTVYPGKETYSLKSAKITLSKTTYAYTGSAIKPAVTVKYNSKTLKKGTDYKVTFKNNKNVGTATVTITGIGNYKGTIKKTFRIIPAGTSISSLSGSNSALTVKWKKRSAQTSGYEIQLASNSAFTKNKKTVTVSGASKVTKKITGLAIPKKYFVRIRTYKTVSGKKYYSAWSAKKSTFVLAKGMKTYGGHIYKLFDTAANWNEARKKCTSGGGHLVTINSAAEQSFIENKLLSGGKRNCYWLGASRNGSSWKWVTNEKFSYQNWAPQQPDGGANDGLMLYRVAYRYAGNRPGQWNDIDLSGSFPGQDNFFGRAHFGYICEWE